MSAVLDAPAAASINAGADAPRFWLARLVAVTRAKIDHAAVLEKVHDEGTFSARYALLTLASAGIATLGLMQNSVAVIIGAMLVAPLMGPILALGFAIATGDTPWIRRSAATLALGAVLALALSVSLVLLSPIDDTTPEIMARTRPTLFDLGVALLSALAGAYALIKGREGTIIGVAIATALMPPLGVVAFGLATGRADIWQGALMLFITNFLTIALAAALTARFYGFSHHLTPRQTRAQTIGIILAFALLAVPLFLSLRQIAWETRAQGAASSGLKRMFGDDAQVSGVTIDASASPVRVRAVVLAPDLVDHADDQLSARLGSELGRPVSVAIAQFRLGTADAQAVSDASRAAIGGGSATAAAETVAQAARLDALRRDLALLVTPPAAAPDRDGGTAERSAGGVRGPGPDGDAAELGADVPTDRAVVIDPVIRRAVIVGPAVDGAGDQALEAIRARIAARHPGWDIVLLPEPQAAAATARDGGR